MRRSIGVVFLILLVALFSSGCSPEAYSAPIDPENGGIWDKYFVYPLSWLLDESAIVLWGNYGLSILVVTLVIRLLMLPLVIKQFRGTKMMQALQPEMQKLREKFKNDQQKLQQETMKLFQKHNYNPLSGCLPLVVQMPILIAFYHAIMRNEHVNSHTFLWMNLGEADPFYILPLLAGLTTYLQQKIMGTQNSNPQMKMMLVIMPIMIFVFAIYFPSALSLYWVFSNIFSIVQYSFMKGDPLQSQGGATK